MGKPAIYAVIWCDFIPLSLPCADAAKAIETAKAMKLKSDSNGVTLRQLRAVRLDPNDTLHTLWEA